MEKAIYHHGIKGQKWGVRKYQYEDGSLTPAGKERYYGDGSKSIGGNISDNRTSKATKSQNVTSSTIQRPSRSYIQGIYKRAQEAIRSGNGEQARTVLDTLHGVYRITTSSYKDKNNPVVKNALNTAKETLKSLDYKELDRQFPAGVPGLEGSRYLNKDDELEDWLLRSPAGLGYLQTVDLISQGYTQEEISDLVKAIDALNTAKRTVRTSPVTGEMTPQFSDPLLDRSENKSGKFEPAVDWITVSSPQKTASSIKKQIKKKNDMAKRNNANLAKGRRNLAQSGTNDSVFIAHSDSKTSKWGYKKK